MIGLEHCTKNAQSKTCLLLSSALVGLLPSNPLDKAILQPLMRLTDTLPAWMIYHEAQAAMCQIMAHVQMHEQLDELLSQVEAIGWALSMVLLLWYKCSCQAIVKRNRILSMTPLSSVAKAICSCSVSPAPLRVILRVVVQNLPHLTSQPGGKEFDVEFVRK